jgi:thermitase
VVYSQPNYKLNVFKNPSLKKFAGLRTLDETPNEAPNEIRDNPAIPPVPSQQSGKDPQMAKQWGMIDNGVEAAWAISTGAPIIVAVIDTGVDYTHEDLVGQMWRNTKEIPDNNIDDDNNGYVDDIVGWDMLSDDNKPYDMYSSNLMDILNGKNPGHGTHCAGTIGAAVNNSKGIVSVSPNTKIMAIRFIGDEGGTTTAAVKGIKYAVDNGAKVLSNSWGSEGEDSEDPNENKMLVEAIQYAMDHDVLFVAAAGNSSRNNDTDKLKAFPASYEHENIIAVAAIDSGNRIASFSNFGAQSVDLGAPGVKIMSTVPGSRYQDAISEILGANWDGTSMAAPYVAGAAALYWSAHPEKNFKEVKDAILGSTKSIAGLTGKTLTGGKLSVEELMKK